jgi:hypothetical protein
MESGAWHGLAPCVERLRADTDFAIARQTVVKMPCNVAQGGRPVVAPSYPPAVRDGVVLDRGSVSSRSEHIPGIATVGAAIGHHLQTD